MKCRRHFFISGAAPRGGAAERKREIMKNKMEEEGIPYRAQLDGARPCEASDMRGARMGIPYRAQLDGARPCEASDMRGARMGIHFWLKAMFIAPFTHTIQNGNQ